MKVLVLLGSARQGRQGEAVAKWAVRQLEKLEINAELVDTAALGLPFYNEPVIPAAIKNFDYSNPKGAAWAKRVNAADGFVLVTPEYNHGVPAVLKNAVDWVASPWEKKPVGIVSYSSGPIAGARVAEQWKPVLLHIGLHPVTPNIHVPKVAEFFDEKGEPVMHSFSDMVASIGQELILYDKVLSPLRK